MKLLSLLLPVLLLVSNVWSITYSEAIKKAGKSSLKITDSNYQTYLNNEDYHLIILLTANSPGVGCQLCVQFQPMYDLFANSFHENLYNKGLGEEDEKVIMATSDFSDCQKFYMSIGLNNVPRIFHYKPGAGKTNPKVPSSEYPFTESLNLPSWTLSILKTNPHFFTPIEKVDYMSAGITAGALLVATLVFIKKRDKLLTVFFNKRGWQGFSIIVIILFTAGYMFNVIRNTNYFKNEKDGAKTYFQSGHQNQFGIETQIISVLYGSLAILMIGLLEKIPKLENSKLKLIGVLFVNIFVYLLYSYLVACFQKKGLGYPYWLLQFD